MSTSEDAEWRPVILTVAEVAGLTRLATSTLSAWRASGKGPRSFSLGRRVVYFEADVLAWLDNQVRTSGRGGI